MSSRLAMMPDLAHQDFARQLSMLWFTQQGADVLVICGDGIELKAHQSIIRCSPWFASTFDIQRVPMSEIKRVQLEERASIIRPLLAFCYGVDLPLLKKGPKSENQMRNLVDLYHVNHWKFHVPDLAAVCEAALANPGDDVESPVYIGEKSPMHGVVSRMLSTEVEDGTYPAQDMYRVDRVDSLGGQFFSTRHNAADKLEQRRGGVTNPSNSQADPFSTKRPADHHRTMDDYQDRRGRPASDETSSTDNVRSSDISEIHASAGFPGRGHGHRGIPIPGAPTMTRLRDRSPGGTPYTSSRLYYEILTMLGPLGMSSPMLDPNFDPPMGSFSPESPNTLASWGMSMSPFLQDRMTPPEETAHLIPTPLRPLNKSKKTSAGNISGLFGPRPLPPGHGSKRSMTLRETETRTLAERPSNASLKDGMFSSLRDVTKRAFRRKPT
ncbi:uncharacterized protein BKA78DRAFT_299511 [Phyllosticta capitalensis]|uniref:uncharacterized protein n=1 Tax=Phyllosticta capitalensis TaxID=121624 RepID=UPI00312CDC7C